MKCPWYDCGFAKSPLPDALPALSDGGVVGSACINRHFGHNPSGTSAANFAPHWGHCRVSAMMEEPQVIVSPFHEANARKGYTTAQRLSLLLHESTFPVAERKPTHLNAGNDFRA
jgi:hypothetical protein